MRRWIWALLALGAALVLVRWAELRPLSAVRAPEGDPDDGAGETAGEGRRCAATTRGGGRCTREAESGSRFCWQHG